MSNQDPVRIASHFTLSRARAVGALILLAANFALPTLAVAGSSPLCAPREKLLKQLSSRYKEVPVALGLASNGSLIEVLTSDKGSTWTIMVTQSNGASCLVAAGEGWEELKRVASSDSGA
jgi:hypothetical protein